MKTKRIGLFSLMTVVLAVVACGCGGSATEEIDCTGKDTCDPEQGRACAPGENGFRLCVKDDDGCWVWSDVFSCSSSQVCQNGTCVDCQPDCGGKECGDDGCGGSCGSCPYGEKCNEQTGRCEVCVPDCAGKVCGPDGCWGSCGRCTDHPNSYCGDDGQCYCEPDCAGRECGDDGCGDTCGTCPPGDLCNEQTGQCEPCVPDCNGKECGDDGCGGSCGACTQFPNSYCDEQFQCACQPDDCVGRECGGNGCGGSCGVCDEFPNSYCNDAFQCDCIPGTCEGKECGTDGCGTSCGECPPGETCDPVDYVCVECIPDCTNRECGDDGCGGSCGVCTAYENSFCEESTGLCACASDCQGKQCGDNGCGGSCGTCDAHHNSYCNDQFQCDCAPDCTGLECGNDGCDGSCGDCAPGLVCVDGACVEPQCDINGFTAVNQLTYNLYVLGELDHLGFASSDDISDILFILIDTMHPDAPAGPGTYPIEDTPYLEGGFDVLIMTDCDTTAMPPGYHACDRLFLANSGTLQFDQYDEADGAAFAGTIENARFIEVTITNDISTPVEGGDVWCLESYTIDSYVDWFP